MLGRAAASWSGGVLFWRRMRCGWLGLFGGIAGVIGVVVAGVVGAVDTVDAVAVRLKEV